MVISQLTQKIANVAIFSTKFAGFVDHIMLSIFQDTQSGMANSIVRCELTATPEFHWLHHYNIEICIQFVY